MTKFSELIPCRIALAGDWHMNTDWAVSCVEWCADRDVDTIVHVGDFGYTFEPAFLADLQAALGRGNIHLGFLDGNHENHNYLNLKVQEQGFGPIRIRDNITYLPRGFRWEWSGVKFLALGGAHSVDRQYRTPGRSWWPDETISWQQAELAISGGPADVMVTHDCPSGVDIPGIEGNPHNFPEMDIRASHEHRELLRAVVDEVKPRLLVHGHYHVKYQRLLRGPGYATEILGLAEDGGPRALNLEVFDMTDLASMMDVS